jgi:hypothetical protein
MDGVLVSRLLDEPALAAAFFQNLDLLYRYSSPSADAMGTMMMRTLELAAAVEAGRAEP